MTRLLYGILLLLLGAGVAVASTAGVRFIDAPTLLAQVDAGTLPPVAERLPDEPSMAAFARPDQKIGRHGGTLRMLMARPKDVRMMVVYGYARLVRYDHRLELVPDILRKVDVEDGRVFTLHLRRGHKWSDGVPFTAEDFRYYWEDVANNPTLKPTGPLKILRTGDALPRFEVIDAHTVRFAWDAPNPGFLAALAGARPPFIYRPAHYLKRFHARYFDEDALNREAKSVGARNWAALHNRLDNPYKFDNPALPTLQPWVATTKGPSERFVFRRNPYFHRVDPQGRQLPYIDRVVMDIVDSKIVPAKTGTGESDLQARYLRFDNFTFLRKNAKQSGYVVHLWRIGRGAHMALYPNFNVKDPVWRKLLRDVRFRRALSLAIHRREINRVLYFGQAIESQNTVLPGSPLHRPEYQEAWAAFDLDEANALLDQIGVNRRNSDGIRLMPDGRPLEIIVETAGESSEQADVLELVHDSWLKVGVKLHIKPSHRDVVRNRIYAGETVMSLFSGLENGMPTAESSPVELAPTRQTQYQWPLWGQYLETAGKDGEAPDMPEALRLRDLLAAWQKAKTRKRRRDIWHEMLALHAEQIFTIGLVAGTLQPVVVGEKLQNVPQRALYNWNPGAQFGIYEPDTFWFEAPEQVTEDRRTR
ncbi:MAG: ABC transporter substrate-binding protein [Alphaproteobacteria bacterium]|nr:ABC transporter substrate-binding protein [Alphaproteobacteria bacterium]